MVFFGSPPHFSERGVFSFVWGFLLLPPQILALQVFLSIRPFLNKKNSKTYRIISATPQGFRISHLLRTPPLPWTTNGRAPSHLAFATSTARCFWKLLTCERNSHSTWKWSNMDQNLQGDGYRPPPQKKKKTCIRCSLGYRELNGSPVPISFEKPGLSLEKPGESESPFVKEGKPPCLPHPPITKRPKTPLGEAPLGR